MGVGCVDMPEVNVDPALRFMAASLMPDGKPTLDGFPLRRDTCLVLDRWRALLWVHGAVAGVKPGRHPYQHWRRLRLPRPDYLTIRSAHLAVRSRRGPSSQNLERTDHRPGGSGTQSRGNS